MGLRSWISATLVVLLAFAGCVGPESDPEVAPPSVDVPSVYLPIQKVRLDNLMTFAESIVSPAQGVLADLYEPTMEVSDTGTIYVAGHVIGAATTGTPAYYSNDDGKTWEVLPFLASLQSPPPVQGSQPPPGDEGFIVAGADGQAWMADIYAAGFTVSGWCGNGAELCYDNRYAYDRVESTTTSCGAATDPFQSTALSLNDRPWAAYANGNLLLVNNPGGGPMQIGVMPVPPATPVGLFDPVTGPEWNLCASPDGWIPGIPSMRDDGFFAVPQRTGSEGEYKMTVVTGNSADVDKVEVHEVFEFENMYGGTSNGGRTAIDEDGTLYVAAYSNGKKGAPKDGAFKVAISQDDGATYVPVEFETDRPVRSIYLDGNMAGPGALLTWSQLGDSDSLSDWFVAHVFVGPNGEPELRNVTLAVDEGPHSSAHVMGAAAGPDGRAYFLNFEEAAQPQDYVGSTPIRVWIQQDGPRLPVTTPVTA